MSTIKELMQQLFTLELEYSDLRKLNINTNAFKFSLQIREAKIEHLRKKLDRNISYKNSVKEF